MTQSRFGTSLLNVSHTQHTHMKNQDPKEYARQIAAIASKLAAQFEWDCNAALDISVALLSETNWHTLATKLESEAEKLIEDELQAEAKAEDLYNASLNK